MAEHLVYLTQRGRSTLGALSGAYQQLSALLSLLGELGGEGVLAVPPQVGPLVLRCCKGQFHCRVHAWQSVLIQHVLTT